MMDNSEDKNSRAKGDAKAEKKPADLKADSVGKKIRDKYKDPTIVTPNLKSDKQGSKKSEVKISGVYPKKNPTRKLK